MLYFHYFGSSKTASHIKLKQSGYLKNIRQNGITREVEEYVDNILDYYAQELKITMDEDLEFFTSTLADLQRKNLNQYRILNNLLAKFLKITGK